MYQLSLLCLQRHFVLPNGKISYLLVFSFVKLKPTIRKMTRSAIENIIVIASEIICIISSLIIIIFNIVCIEPYTVN